MISTLFSGESQHYYEMMSELDGPHHDRQRLAASTEIQYRESEIKRSEAGTIQLDNNLLLVLEDTDPFPCDSEPVFWTD